jgi:hypothetical protein
LCLAFPVVDLFIYLFIFGGTGVCTQGFTLAKQALYRLSQPPVHLALVILEMGSPELSVWAGLKLQSS